MFHICHEEVLAVMSGIAGLRLIVPWLRAKIHEWRGCSHSRSEVDSEAQIPPEPK